MAKRKRVDSESATLATKKLKQTSDSTVIKRQDQHETSFPTISRFYDHVLSLKNYILKALPSGSRLRVKRVLSFERQSTDHEHFLNQTLVAFPKDVLAPDHVDYRPALQHFARTQRAANTGSAASQHCSLDEVS